MKRSDLIGEAMKNDPIGERMKKSLEHDEEILAQVYEQMLTYIKEDIFTQYNKAILANEDNKVAAKAAFVASYSNLSRENKKKAEAAFDAMYSFYNGEEAKKVPGKDGKEEYAITQAPTAWEKVKAFLLAILTLGLGRSNKYNKETVKSFAKIITTESAKVENYQSEREK